MRAVGYVRVSTEDQAREGISLDNQEAKIEAYVAINGLELVGIIRDEGTSGKSLDRAGMTKLLKLVEAGEVEAVVVYKLDRLSRKTLDNLQLIERFEYKGVAFHSISEKIDTKSATGKFFLTIASAMAQMERDLIAERTRDALLHKKTKGEWVGRVPFGFKVEGTKLSEDTEEMKVVQKAKRMRRNGKSMRDIAGALNLSVGTVHKLLNVNLRRVRALYSRGFRTRSVQKGTGLRTSGVIITGKIASQKRTKASGTNQS
jgi:DNA invertase Pin-like site-specific DNA recombinase